METPDWQAEIVELHAFFEGWLGGALPESDAVFTRLVDATAPEFALIGPEGGMIGRGQLIADLRAAHASRPGWRMWIANATLRAQEGGLTITTYEEWQRHADGMITGRLSTAVFRAQPGAPNGLAWLHVHETWLPSPV